MNPTLRYGDSALAVPRGPFRLEPVVPPGPPGPPLDDAAIGAALDAPEGVPGLRELFRGARRVVVAVSDATRATGAARFLPPLLERIREAARPEIAIAIGSGIHRRPTAGDVRAILGDELASSCEIVLHDPDAADLVDIGRTRAGTRVAVHPRLAAADRVVLTGAVGFHYYAGFSGGRKAIVPGLASRETITANHLRALRADGSRHPGACAGRLDGNPVHRDMVEGAARVGPHLVVNTVIGPSGAIEAVAVGHWRRAHEKACRYVRSTRTVRVTPRPLVVASAGGHPTDVDLIQSHKTFEAGIGAVARGGVFILVAECREGAGHPDFLPWFAHADEAAFVRALKADFKVYGQTALSWFRKARDHRLILVSALDSDLVSRIGAVPARDLDEAFAAARRLLPEGAEGWLLPSGSKLLVRATA